LGGPSRYLARRYGCRVRGLDLSPACVQGATILTEAENLTERVRFIQGDAWDMPFADSQFDVVWGQDSWPHREGLFEECARVLRPEGIIAFTNSVRGAIRTVINDDEEEVSYEAFTADEYREMLLEAGFETIRMENISGEIIPLWQDLEQRLKQQITIWQQRLGPDRLNQEQEALAVTIEDYIQGRIEHVRMTARKRR